jgi:NDP-sugar pyrophosphorylase family protein
MKVTKKRSITALVLAGGLGTRLRHVIGALPKALAPVGDRPFLEYILLQLRNQSVSDVIICTGYGAGEIQEYFKKGTRWGMNIRYTFEKELMGTGGAIKLSEDLIPSDKFLVLNGDSLVQFELRRLVELHTRKKAGATMVLVNVSNKSRFGSVNVSRDNLITDFNEKSKESTGLINAGVYLFEHELLSRLPSNKNISIEYDFFPKLAGHDLYGLIVDGPFLDIGTPESYEEAQSFLTTRFSDIIPLNER